MNKEKQKGPRGIFLGVICLGALSCFLVIGLMAWQTERERSERIRQEKEALSRMAEIVATETADIFARTRFFMESADLWLSVNPEADPRTDPDFGKLVETFRASMQGKADIQLVSETGGLFRIPSKDLRTLADVRDRGYYKTQINPGTKGFHIGDPIQGKVSQLWAIPISYPLALKNAGISMILVTIESRVLDQVYEAIRPKPDGSISVIRKDGIVLARSPFDEGILGKPINPDAAAWKRNMDANPIGAWIITRSSGDKTMRVLAYNGSVAPDFVVSVSAVLDEVLKPWRTSLWWRGLVVCFMVAAISLVSAQLLSALKVLASAQAELHGNLERLRRSDETKNKLFSVIAHDLRGPIGGMANLLETLSTDRDDMKSETVGEFIDALRAASWNTSQLLENLLAWSRSQRGEIPFRPERILVLPLVQECLDLFRLTVAEKGIRVTTSVDAGLEARADLDQLKSLIRNLVSNAVKFTMPGKAVFVSAERVEGGARIEVRDEGIGMDSGQLASLYDLGSVRSRSGTANERGSGLGLAICMEIVERHGGRIEASSAVGEGSWFAVFLPD